eukprot:1161752-Pelagomonas_calceolata.AAC.1
MGALRQNLMSNANVLTGLQLAGIAVGCRVNRLLNLWVVCKCMSTHVHARIEASNVFQRPCPQKVPMRSTSANMCTALTGLQGQCIHSADSCNTLIKSFELMTAMHT